MVLEWIAGDERWGADLHGWIQTGPLDLQLALNFTIDICCGLIHAQQKQPGIVHLDLKPRNILITPDRLAKITDFGLARIVQVAELKPALPIGDKIETLQSLTGLDGLVGTPPYMAPEQWRHEALDSRTDIYAIGCILYEMLTRRWPFQAATFDDMRRQHLEAVIPKLGIDQPAYSSIDTIIARCLAKQIEERYSTVTELLQEIEIFYQQQFAELPQRVAGTEFSSKDYSNRGVTYYKLHRYDEALTDFNQALKLNANSPLVYNNRANTFADLQQYEKAIADYTQAIELDPNYAEAYANRGSAYHELGQYEAALADYNWAIQLDPDNAVTYNNRGNTNDKLNKHEQALADFDRAIQLDPEFARAYSNRGTTYSNFQRYQKASEDFNKAIQLDPTNAEAYNNLGLTYVALQQYEQALPYFSQATKIVPTYTRAFYNRGVTYENLQQYDEALEDYQQVIRLDTNYTKAYLNIGNILINKKGKAREALPYLEKAAHLGDIQAPDYVIRVRKRIGLEILQQANSPDEVRHNSTGLPFMKDSNFISGLEQIITQEIPPEHRPFFLQRLTWLRQIATEQQQERENQ